MNEKSLIFLTFEQIRDILRVRDFTFYKEKMSEALTLSKGFDEMGKSIKEKVKSELEALNTKISKGSKNLSEKSTTNEILSQLQNKELDELKNSLLRNTAIQMKLKELNYNVWTIDGIYGNQTWQAVKQFQKNNNVEGSKKRNGEFDGIAGKETMNKMLEGNLQKWEEVSNKKEKQTSNKAVERGNQNERKEKGAKGEVYTVKRLEKFEDLPKGYTWNNDSIKYEIANPTDPKKIYRFYSNGAYKSPYDNKVYLTKDLINGKLNNNKPDQKVQISSHKEIAEEYHSTIITQAKEIFKEFSLDLYEQEDLNIYTSYKDNKLYFDISKYCDSRGNLTQKEQLKTDIKNQKDQIDKKEKNKAELKKAETFLKGKTYKVNRLFKDNPKVSWSKILKKDDIKYATFFKKFSNETIVFDKNSKIDGGNLILELDQRWTNEHKHIKIPLKELGIDSKNFIFGQSISYRNLENNFRKALAKKIDEIVG